MAITKATASSIAPAAKGDLVVGSGTNDASILAVGTNTHILTADSSTATGLKWAAASAGTWTQAATGSLSGATVNITGLSGKKFAVFLIKYSHNSGSSQHLQCYLNGDNTAKYYPFTDPSPTNPMTPCGVTTFAAANTRNDGFYVDMADTALDYKIIQPITPKNNFENGGLYNSTSAITQINLLMSGGSFDAGTYYVWSFS